jgi:hypothetical protein
LMPTRYTDGRGSTKRARWWGSRSTKDDGFGRGVPLERSRKRMHTTEARPVHPRDRRRISLDRFLPKMRHADDLEAKEHRGSHMRQAESTRVQPLGRRKRSIEVILESLCGGLPHDSASPDGQGDPSASGGHVRSSNGWGDSDAGQTAS